MSEKQVPLETTADQAMETSVKMLKTRRTLREFLGHRYPAFIAKRVAVLRAVMQAEGKNCFAALDVCLDAYRRDGTEQLGFIAAAVELTEEEP